LLGSSSQWPCSPGVVRAQARRWRGLAMIRGRRIFTLAASAAVVTGLAVAVPAAAPDRAAAAVSAVSATVAPGAPGASSYFDLARKDCVGTAAGTGSKVWFTVADGVLSDVYEPTGDQPNGRPLADG